MKPQEMNRYQDIIIESMARTIWLMAYADWAERVAEDEENETSDYEGPEIARPEGGQDWDDFAPKTPLGATQAAGDLYSLIKESYPNIAASKAPLSELFVEAMTIHLGHSPFLADEPWISNIKDADASERNDEAMVYADWLEQQGREMDAAHVRVMIQHRRTKEIADQMNRIDDAERFGSVLVHMAEGTGVHWGDDYKTWRKHPDEDWTKQMPSFGCYYNGEILSWDGKVRDKDARPSSKAGTQRAVYEGENEEVGGPQDLNPDASSSVGERHIIIVNPNDANFYRHSYVLWTSNGGFSTADYLLIYANSLDDALDEMIDWIAENRPGHLANEMVAEQYKELEDAWTAANPGEELDDETRWAMMEQAEEDTTSGGNANDRIFSENWGIALEDPSPRDLLLFSGLNKNPAKRNPPKAPKALESPWDALATVMFRNTVTARMLRILARRRQITQAEFTRDWTRRSNRKPTAYQIRKGEDKANISSLVNNLGRFIQQGHAGQGFWAEFYSWGESRHPGDHSQRIGYGYHEGPACLKVMRQERLREGSTHKLLRWVGPDPTTLLANMSPEKLQWAFENLEHQMLNHRETDDVDLDFGWWLERIRPRLVKQNPSWSLRGIQNKRPVPTLRRNPGAVQDPIVAEIREACAAAFGDGIDYPYFYANALPGETPDETILRVYTEERNAQVADGGNPTPTQVINLLIHG